MAAAPAITIRLIGVLHDQGRLAFAAINAMLQLKKSLFAIGVDIVGNRRSAQRDGFFQHLLHRHIELAADPPESATQPGGAAECPRETATRRHKCFPRHSEVSDSAGHS